MDNINEMINKSLDEIDAMSEEFSKSLATEETEEISKAVGDEDLNAGEVSEDAPEEGSEDAPEEGAPEADDEGSSNEDVDADEEGEEDAEEDEEVEKSLEGELKSNESVRKALEVSEFLQELVKSLDKTISTHIGTHNEGLSKSIQSSKESNEILAKSLVGIVKSQRSIMEGQTELHKSIRTLNKRLKAIEEQPMVRKSVASAQPINKSFEASAGDKPKATNQLSKSQISAKLTQAFESGNTALMTDVLAFESTGKVETLSNEAKTILGL